MRFVILRRAGLHLFKLSLKSGNSLLHFFYIGAALLSNRPAIDSGGRLAEIFKEIYPQPEQPTEAGENYCNNQSQPKSQIIA